MEAKLKTIFGWPKNNIFDVIDIFLVFYRYLNITQFSMHKVKLDQNHYKRYIETNLWHFTTFYGAIGFYLFLIYHHVTNETLFKTTTPLFDYGNQLFLIAVYVAAIYTIINNMILRLRFWDLLIQLDSIDTQLKYINFPLDHNTQFTFLCSTYSTCVVYVIAIIIYLIWTDDFTWFQILSETCSVALFCFMLAMGYGLTVLLVFRFKMLNRAIRHYFIDNCDATGAGLEQILHFFDNYIDMLFLMRGLYADLCSCMDTGNLCVSLHLMFSTAVSFIFSLLTWFSAYCVYFLDSSESTLNTVICICLLNLSGIYILLLILGSGEKLKLEGMETLKIINMAMIKLKDDKDICCELIKFSQQIRHKHPVFTCGLFPFDLTLINSLIGGLVSYLIILIQFQTSNMI